MVRQEKPADLVASGAALSGGDLDGAIAAYREAIRLRPDFLQAHRHLRNALRRRGDVQGALDACREVLRLRPGDPEALRALGDLAAEQATALLSKADALAADGSLDGAIAAYRDVLRLRPDWAEAHQGLGTALVAKGDFPTAADECREAIRLRPDYPEAHFHLGDALAGEATAAPAVPDPARVPVIAMPAEGKPDQDDTRTQAEAIGTGNGAADPSSSGYRAAIREGNALAERGDLDGAIARYREAVRLKPDVPEAHNNLGVALRRKGDLAGAIAACHAAVRLKPGAAEAHNNLAVALRAKGDYPSAIVSSREAARLRPDLAPAWYNLACAYALAGDARQAADGLRHAIGLDVKYRELARREPDLRKVRRAREVIRYLGEPGR